MANFSIVKEYLKCVKFSSPHTPGIFFNNDDGESKLAINIDVKCKSASDSLCDVTLSVTLSPTLKDKEIFFLELEYSSLVLLNMNNGAGEEEKRRVLLVEVPLAVYPIVRDFVAQITFRSGFPPVHLQNFDFEQHYQSKQNDDLSNYGADVAESDCENGDGEKFTYQTIVTSFSDTKEGKDFLQACISRGMNPELDFEETPMYKYLMRFIEVPLFNFPLIIEASVEWPFFEALFRMMVLDGKTSYRFVKGEVLELYVTYGDIVDKPISKLDLCELDSLATSLIIDMWVNFNVPLSQIFPAEYQSKTGEYLDSLCMNQMITKDEYFGLFEKNANPGSFDWNMIQQWYQKLREIDLSTIKYRF
ncbi:MAG: protein-export chaperone SecB [Clostridiales bacterium]|nr:protein-export chaperone SecB [Clostridiales bacterium]